MGRTRLLITQVRRTGVPELSAVAIAQGRIYVADDELGVAELGMGGAHFGGNGALEGVEGLTASGDGKSLYAVSESTRRLHRFAITHAGALGKPIDLGKLPRAADTKKKGWEGLAWLPQAMNPERRDRLVAVNEDKPRCVGLFTPEDLDDHVILALPASLEEALEDLSDVAIEPSTGLLWLLSDESSAIGVAALVKDENGELVLESREVIPLPVKGAQSEGIVFDAQGRLLIGSEEGGLLHTLDIQRDASKTM